MSTTSPLTIAMVDRAVAIYLLVFVLDIVGLIAYSFWKAWLQRYLFKMHFSTIAAVVLSAGAVSAHGNHDLDREIAMREAVFQYTSKDLIHYAAKIKSRGLKACAAQRRSDVTTLLINNRSIKGMSFTTPIASMVIMLTFGFCSTRRHLGPCHRSQLH